MIQNLFVTDAHCHVFPEKIAARAVEGTDRFYGIRLSHGDGTVTSLLREGVQAGIDRFVIHSVATTPRQATSINRFIAGCVEQAPDRLTGLGTLHPDSDDLRRDVEEILALGLHGVKLHPDIQGFRADDPRCLKIYDLCTEFDLPVLMHTGDKRYDNSNPNRILPLLARYPSLTLVGAHFGGWSIWEEASRELAGTPNLYVDCSSSFYALDDDAIRRIIERYTPDRVLFGSDYPMWDPAQELDRFLSLGYSADEYRKMLSANAAKVFHIAEGEGSAF